jgi:hypothetical protein
MKIPVQLTTPPIPKAPWWQALQQIYEQVATAVNGKLEIGAGVPQSAGSVVPCINLDAVSCVYVSGTAGSDDVVLHNLGRVPYGYILVGSNFPMAVYSSPTAWTATKIFLRSSQAGATVRILVF